MRLLTRALCRLLISWERMGLLHVTLQDAAVYSAYRHRIMRTLLFSLVLLVAGFPVLAQIPQGSLDDGKQAFREERFAEAAAIFDYLAMQEPDNAETHFLVARVYFETPLRDKRKARRAIQKALELEPDNVEYMVASLQQYRTDSWNFITERIKETRRLELSRRILKLDPDNAFAHEELGLVNIRDFWRYRNAIMLPMLHYGYVGGSRRSETQSGSYEGVFGDQTTTIDEMIEQQALEGTPIDGFSAASSPDEVFLNDRFDVEALKSQGTPVVDLSRQADRAYERAIGHLRKSIEVDPRRRTVYDELMEIFALKGEYEDALEMLNQMYRFFPEDSDMWRYFGLAHYQLGDMNAADLSFSTAFEYMDEEEEKAYNDLELFLRREEEALFEEDPVAYAARFWTSQDPRFLTPYNERKLEHYFRLTYADLLYGSPDLDLRGWDTQRGQILARYGPPQSDVVIMPRSDGVSSAREALVGAVASTISGTDEVGRGTFGRQVAGSASFGAVLSTAREAFEEMNAYNIWEYGAFRFVFEDPFRNGEYRMYSPPAELSATQLTTWQNDYVIRTNETIQKTPQRYEYTAPGRQIELPFLVTTFKGEEDKTDLYVHYGIPINEYDASTDMIEITANTGTFLVNDQRDILVERRRTIYGLRTDQVVEFAEQDLWVDTQEMEAPPGDHDVSVEFETASGHTVAVQRRSIEVPDYGGDRVALSNIMLAYRVETTSDGKPLSPNEVARGDLSILPAPWSVYATDWPIYLYFEVYNLETGPEGHTDYDVEIVLSPRDEKTGIRRLIGRVFGGGDPGVAVSYEGSGTEPDEALYQILDASEEEMGLYTLVLRVTDNVSGKTVEREQDLFLEE